METINSNRMDLILAKLKGAKFAGLTTATATKLNKTNGEKGEAKRLNPFHGKVKSVRNVSFLFCYDYNANVERARVKQEKEADAWKKGTSWHQPVLHEDGSRSAFVEHKDNGTKYLYGRTLHKGTTTYAATERVEHEGVVYNAGDEVPYSVLKPFWSKSKSYGNQGLADGTEIAATTLKFESVQGMRVGGSRYRIEQNEVAEVAAVIERFLGDMPEVSADDVPSDQTDTADN